MRCQRSCAGDLSGVVDVWLVCAVLLVQSSDLQCDPSLFVHRSCFNQIIFMALLIEVIAPYFCGVVSQTHAPFISVVDINAEPAPFADQVGVDVGVSLIFDQS